MIYINPLRDAQLRSKAYAYFRGCDFTTDATEIDDSRSPDALNLIADDAGFPEKRVGWRVMSAFTGTIYGLHYAHFAGVTNPVIIVHHGAKLSAYDIVTGTVTQILSSGMAEHKSQSFMHKGYLYLLDGSMFRRLTYSGGYVTTLVADDAKVPTTGVGGHYEYDEDTQIYTWIACTPYNEPNLLTAQQKNEFAGDGVNKDFWLTERGTTVTTVEIYSGSPAAWTETTAYTVTEDTTLGKTKLTFTNAPAAHPEGAGLDNIRVTFTSTENPQQKDVINKCTICTPFGYFNDNRIFVSGNPDNKNRDWACGVDDPTYWEKNQWTDIGSDHTAVMGYLHYGDVLAIVKEDDNQDAEIYIRSAVVQEDNSVLYPVQQGVKGVGAISRGAFASLRDDALFYAREGVYAVYGTDASQQRTVQNRSYYVDNKLRTETNKADAVATVWNNRYLLCFPSSGHCYVADAKLQTGMNESFVYEWFYWTNIPASVFLEFDGNLFFGTDDGRLCRFNDDMLSVVKYSDELVHVPDADQSNEHTAWAGGKAIKAKWTTKADTFGTIAHVKTLTKRGCTVMLKPFSHSSAKVYITTHNMKDIEVRTEYISVWDFGDIDFAHIDFNAMSTPQVVPIAKKIKKFQQIQIAIENDGLEEGLGIYKIQVQYTVNNYIK